MDDIRNHLFEDITNFYTMLYCGGVLWDNPDNDLRSLLDTYNLIHFKRVWLVSPCLLQTLKEADLVGFEYCNLQFWLERDGDMDRLKATWND